jgi:hypothetical protein
MKLKLKLSLEDLRVDAFETAPAAADRRGTVHALQVTEAPTCEWSCGGTCPTGFLDMLTCGESCNCS